MNLDTNRRPNQAHSREHARLFGLQNPAQKEDKAASFVYRRCDVFLRCTASHLLH